MRLPEYMDASHTFVSESEQLDGQHKVLLPEGRFRRAVKIERKRAQRSGSPALLLMFDIEAGEMKNGSNTLVQNVIAAILTTVRETDFAGWHADGKMLGALFTQLPSTPHVQKSVAAIGAKIEEALQSELGERCTQVRITSQLFAPTTPQPRRRNPALLMSTTQ